MEQLLITPDHFQTLSEYHTTLTRMPQRAQWLVEHLGIGNEPLFLQLYKPALDKTLWLASNRLNQWPDLYTVYPKAFHDQQRLNADIRLFNERFESTLDTLPRDQRQDYLSKLDLRQSPFQLEGKLLVLTVGPAWPFAQEMKAKVTQTYSAFYSGAGVIDRLYQNNREILPRFEDFMNGSLDVYIGKHKLDPSKGDARTAVVKGDIEQTELQISSLVRATEELHEGFARLVNMQGEASKEFSSLFSTISAANFQLMVELAIHSLDEAERMARL